MRPLTWQALAFLLCLGCLLHVQAAEVLDGIAAIVNDEIITISEVREAMALDLEQQPNRSATETQRLYREALQRLIDAKLQLARAKQLQLKVSDDEVAAQVQAVKEESHLSDAELERMLQSRGLTMEVYRQRIREGLLIAKAINAEVRSRLVIDEEELRQAYAERRQRYQVPGELTVSHILFLVPPTATAEEEARIRQRAAEVLAQLRRGADFATLARRYSEGPSAERGGLLGTFRQGELLPGFEEAAAALQPGEISDLVRTRVGFHIIRLEAKKAGNYRPFEAVKDELRAELLEQKTAQRYQEWLESLRQQAYIKIVYEGV
ncbi:MAG: chaperone SurA [Candidatus Tectimicrobiota bacterium]|nr:MAG: chaperone SurA [Candidatus Tectomicrobia bacterium]